MRVLILHRGDKDLVNQVASLLVDEFKDTGSRLPQW